MKPILNIVLVLLLHYTALAKEYAIKYIGINDGLSNEYVVDITEDKEGYIWFATEEGLNRFDGKFISSFYSNRDGSSLNLAANELNALLDDPDSCIMWVATQRSGLNAIDYKNNSIKSFSSQNSDLVTNDITDLKKSGDGKIWITTYSNGIDLLDKEGMSFTHYQVNNINGLVSNKVWTCFDDNNGKLYVGHPDSGLSIISIKDKTAVNYQHDPKDKNSLPGNEVLSIFQDKMGSIWVGTDKGLALFNTATHQFESLAKFNPKLALRIFDIRQFSDNKLWVSTEFGGAVAIDVSQRSFSGRSTFVTEDIDTNNTDNNLSSSTVRTLFEDSNRNIWMGTWGGGVNFISRIAPLFNSVRLKLDEHKTQHQKPAVLSINYDTGKKDFWIGTDGEGIYLIDDNRQNKHYQLQAKRGSASSVQVIHTDKYGNQWFGLFLGGLIYHDCSKDTFVQVFNTKNAHVDVRSIYEDNSGHLWVGTTSGLFVFDSKTKKLLHYFNRLKDNDVRCVTLDSYGNIWLGSFGSGLYVYDHSMKLKEHFDTSSGFPSNTINYIFRGSENNIWIASGNGLVKFQLRSSEVNSFYTVFNKSNHLSNTHIRAITEDLSGNIWFSTNRSISCIRKSDNSVLNYDHHLSSLMGSFNSGCVENCGQTIYFGSTNGVYYFNPEYILNFKKSPKVEFTQVHIFEPIGKRDNNNIVLTGADIGKKLNISYDYNNLDILFAVKNYAYDGYVNYSYRLNNKDDLWYPIPGNNIITLRNLSPGDYTIQVRTRIINQKWSTDYTQLKLHIHPPVWMTWWAICLYILLLILVVLLFVYIREKRIKAEYLYESERIVHEQDIKLNNEHLQFYTNITHELRTPLTLILGPIEDLLNSPTLQEKDLNKLSLIHKNTFRLFNLVNRLLDFRKTETNNKRLCVAKGNVVKVIQELGLKYKELNRKENVNIVFTSRSSNISLFFDKETLTVILDNLMSNAIKNTDSGSVILSVEQVTIHNERYVEFKVVDTGCGITESDLAQIFDRYFQTEGKNKQNGTGIGLALVKSLVQLHEGEITAHSKPNFGTAITIRFLQDNNYPNAMHMDNEEKKQETRAEDIDKDKKLNRSLVLIVEDNIDICEYIEDELSGTYEVEVALNGREGIEKAMASMPDIIVSDIMMPEVDGLQLCKELKNNINTSHIPIVLLTAKNSMLNKEEGYDAGADSYLTKPFSSSLLKTRLKNILFQRAILASKLSAAQQIGKTLSLDAEKTSDISEIKLSELDQKFLHKISDAVIENLPDNIVDVKYLTDYMSMSHSTLYRKVKALTNSTINEYIRKVKLNHSAELLKEGNFMITEVAFKIGMSSHEYFRKCFKEEFGCSPSEYIRRFKKS